MYRFKLQFQLAILLLIASIYPAALASDIDQLDWTGIKEHWGQVLLCQRIYSLAEVKPRLYDFDIKHCEQAARTITGVVEKYTEAEQAELKAQAERHATLLSRNTPEPYQVVPACREFCRDLAEPQE